VFGSVQARVFVPGLSLFWLLGHVGPARAAMAGPGYTGLITTPTAEVVPDGKVETGFFWLEGVHTYLFAPKTNRLLQASAGLWPGLEVTLRFTQVVGWVDPEAPAAPGGHAVDRMASVKWRLPLPDSWLPLAVGVQDMGSVNQLAGIMRNWTGATQYGQTTLYAATGSGWGPFRWHAGWATPARNLAGAFGGLEASLPLGLVPLLEWDGRGWNVAIRWAPGENASVLVGRLSGDTWIAGGCLRLGL